MLRGHLLSLDLRIPWILWGVLSLQKLRGVLLLPDKSCLPALPRRLPVSLSYAIRLFPGRGELGFDVFPQITKFWQQCHSNVCLSLSITATLVQANSLEKPALAITGPPSSQSELFRLWWEVCASLPLPNRHLASQCSLSCPAPLVKTPLLLIALPFLLLIQLSGPFVVVICF